MSQSDQVEAQMETIFAAVSGALKSMLDQYRDLQQAAKQKIESFDEEIFDFCDELESMRLILIDDSESLSVRVGCVGNVIDFINNSFQDVHTYFDTLESKFGVKRESIIDDNEWNVLKKPNLQFYKDKQAELELLLSQHPEFVEPELKVTSSWKNLLLKPDNVPAIVFVITSLVYLLLRLWSINQIGYVVYAYAAVFAISAMAFLTWISQANDNLVQEKISGLEFTPSRCIVSFFVPFLCLYWPYQAMVEIWKASSVVNKNWKAASTPLIIPVWWLSFLAAKGLQIILLTSLMMNSAYFTQVFYLSIILDCIATVLAINIVIMITMRQSKEYKMLT